MNNNELILEARRNIARIINRASDADIIISDDLFNKLNEIYNELEEVAAE